MKRENITVNLSELTLNEYNPRVIKKQQLNRLKRSIQDFPEMAELRPIVVDENNVVLGGNMRLRAMRELGIDKAEVVRVSGLTDKQKREFIVKDNVPFGEWDWDALANEWDAEELNDWGLDVPWGGYPESNGEESTHDHDGYEVAIVAAKTINGIDKMSQVYQFKQIDMTDAIRERVARCRVVYEADDL